MAANFWTSSHYKHLLDQEDVDMVNTLDKEKGITLEDFKLIKMHMASSEYSGVQLEFAPDFEFSVSNKTPEFLKMNPLGKFPVLETPDGPVFESNAIARYVARLNGDNALYLSTPIDNARIDQWIDFSTLEIDSNILKLYLPG
ncbi:hypothetical protein LR48_Vigan03g121300 [Vigna angularis]|uniref:GST N-terminal domain-containing protein n=1 Tax=Phaseolus angularis TaxID=3914 RepID=A0A0L9U4X3_PHAAN|nr:hypothetical protein LR48_Vigan03g121300 [Vigna angularis]